MKLEFDVKIKISYLSLEISDKNEVLLLVTDFLLQSLLNKGHGKSKSTDKPFIHEIDDYMSKDPHYYGYFFTVYSKIRQNLSEEFTIIVDEAFAKLIVLVDDKNAINFLLNHAINWKGNNIEKIIKSLLKNVLTGFNAFIDRRNIIEIDLKILIDSKMRELFRVPSKLD